jgi:hypothetical protein
LGYGAGIRGSGFGQGLSDNLIGTAKEIVDLGVSDPDLFVAMALFESDIGPDRISDMTTNVILEALISFNARIIDELGLSPEAFSIRGARYPLLRNPTQQLRTPLLLVPIDILRDLPIARDWDGIQSAAARNEELRGRVNKQIAHIWAAKSKRDKRTLRAQALASAKAFATLLDAIHEVGRKEYDAARDSAGVVRWPQAAEEVARAYPLELAVTAAPGTLECVHEVTRQMVEQFRHLVETCGLNKELYKENRKPRHESTAQRLLAPPHNLWVRITPLQGELRVDSELSWKRHPGLGSEKIEVQAIYRSEQNRDAARDYPQPSSEVQVLCLHGGAVGGAWRSGGAGSGGSGARQRAAAVLEVRGAGAGLRPIAGAAV